MRALVLIVFLMGCEQASDEMLIKRKYVANETELRKECGDDLIIEPLGCAKQHGKSCTIVAYKPRGYDDHRRVETLGHELLHCFDGPKHT